MKTFKINIFLILALALFTFSCQEDDAEFGDFIAPTNLQISAEIIGVDASNPNGDGSGRVILTATADNAISYNFEFGDGQNGMFASGIANHRFSLVGLNTYTVVVSAIGTGGNKTIGTITIDVFSSFDDYDAKLLLSGGAGSTKTWYWAAADIAHLGVGPANASIGEGFWYPQWYAAQPFEKAGSEESSCIYEDQLNHKIQFAHQQQQQNQ